MLSHRCRPHAAEEVFVTGTFDDWSKSAQLEKNGDVFEKSVDLPKTDEKILYKVRSKLFTAPKVFSARTSTTGIESKLVLFFSESIARRLHG